MSFIFILEIKIYIIPYTFVLHGFVLFSIMVGAGLPLCADVCVYMQPLELIKNVCCNLFYYGRHLLFDPATKTPRNPPRKNPIPIWGIYLEMHLYSAFLLEEKLKQK